jgi:YidC/Oxa1 family membrane protein insertase
MIEFVSLIWNEAITRPMTNSLMLLYVALGNNLGLAIIAFTVVVRGMTFRLVVRQMTQTRKMQSLQPRIKVINEKYKDDPKARGAAVMAEYKATGVNPVGCLGPLVVQMPIFIGLFWAINNVLPFKPESLAGLSTKLYGFLPFLDNAVPVSRQFLGMDLALEPMRAGNILAFILVGLSGLTMLVQQKMTMMPSADPQQQQTQRMMTFMFPVMFGIFSLVFPIGLVIYWVASNTIGIVMQYFITGGGGLRKNAADAAGSEAKSSPDVATAEKEQGGDGELQPREVSQDSGGSDRARSARTRRRPRRGRGRRN